VKGCVGEIFLKMLKSFVNFVLSNSKNISEGKIRCPCAKFKNKNIHHKDIITMHLLKKRVHKKNTQIGLHMNNLMFLTKPSYKGWFAKLLVLAIYIGLWMIT